MMNRFLLLSLSFNAVLLSLAGWTLWQRPLQGLNAPPEDAVPAVSAVDVPPPARTPFHWRELESPDYPVFIANLRAIGCPEHTIRHLIDGELRTIYAEKQAVQASTPADSAITTAAEFEQERLAVLSHLLTPASATLSDTPPLSSPAAEGGTQAAPMPAEAPAPATRPLLESIPAAFLIGDDGSAIAEGQLSTTVTDRDLHPEDADRIAILRQDFESKVLPQGQSPAAPDSPEYRRRWRKAQQENDDRFSSLYGGDALDAMNRQRLLQSSQAAATGGK